MANNFYTKEKEINGVKYVAQFSGMRTAAQFVDQTRNGEDGKSSSLEKMAEFLFKNIIVEPKLTFDDFSDMKTLTEVVKFGTEVMNGNFRDEEDEQSDTATGKK